MNDSKPTPRKCAVCGIPAPDFAINFAYLCDPHFDGWIKRPRNHNIGGSVEMANYVADEQAKRGAA